MKSDPVCLGPQVTFVMGEDTTLGNLLGLQLHRVEDEVKNIVDKAVKEMAIEKVSISTCHIYCQQVIVNSRNGYVLRY